MPDLSEKKHEVPDDFDEVAPTYDFLTGMNPGYHRHLRMSAERLGLAARAPRILDLCCGTGLSTEALLAVYPHAKVVGLDASRGMLAAAKKKPVLRGVEFVHGNAMDPRASGIDGTFDAILMAYGIRNVPSIDPCLAALRELLSPGAPIAFHEYSVKDSRRARLMWDAVSWGIIVPGGLLTAPKSGIYRYLHASVRDFDGVRAFEARLSRAGYADVRTLPMDGWQRGILHTFLARRPG
ncbi:MAG: class I SAM-dependent methyltransferase [Sandaracinus sp.]